MKRTRHFSQRLVRCTSVSVCLALVLSVLAIVPMQTVNGKGPVPPAQGRSGQGNSGRNSQPNSDKAKRVALVPPQVGPPAVSLPKLDEVRQRGVIAPAVALPIPSTLRSRRKPLELRRGRTVGGRVPVLRVSATRTGSDSDHVNLARSEALQEKRGTRRSHHARRTRLTALLVTPPQGGGLVGYWKFDENSGMVAA